MPDQDANKMVPLPCPWCGEVPIVDADDHDDPDSVFWVACRNDECGPRELSDPQGSRLDAVEAWNRNHPARLAKAGPG